MTTLISAQVSEMQATVFSDKIKRGFYKKTIDNPGKV